MVAEYTKEIEEDMYIEYKLNPTKETVDALALKYDKKTRSIISKLSAMGIYQKKKYEPKNNLASKEEYIERIGKLLDIDVDLLGSLEKVTKYALVAIERQIQILKENE